MSKKFMRVLPKKHCFFWHRWKLVKEDLANLYSECKDCGARKVECDQNVYQPIDEGWLFGKAESNPCQKKK